MITSLFSVVLVLLYPGLYSSSLQWFLPKGKENKVVLVVKSASCLMKILCQLLFGAELDVLSKTLQNSAIIMKCPIQVCPNSDEIFLAFQAAMATPVSKLILSQHYGFKSKILDPVKSHEESIQHESLHARTVPFPSR